MPLFTADWIKRGALRINRLLDLLHHLNLVVISKEDLVKFRGGGYRRKIRFGVEGHHRLASLLERDKPFLAARLGAVELTALRFYLEKRQTTGKSYPAKIRSSMAHNAGFFPTDDGSLDSFAELYLKQLPNVDLMGVWFNQYEDVVCNRFCPAAELVDLDCFEPFRFPDPWSSRLGGKKVLVVHPFAESIRKQYETVRQTLFADPQVLPLFELKTVQAVQSIAGGKVEFSTWFDAYHHMCRQMEQIDFDICIIGAGAYGLPLAAYARELEKQAIHLGGVTQILFGIKGKRWETEYADSTAKLFNQQWVRPLPSETPPNRERVDRGCYW
jgi:hypothetical protein